jgi:hypothetical protein
MRRSMHKTGYSRVTTVLSPFSGMKKIPQHILKIAGERGHKVHEICTAMMEEIGLSTFEPPFKGYIDSFDRWREGKDFIERPERFYCDKYKITGEIDGIYEEKGKLVLIDIKTSAKENKTWHLQGSAYSYLCKENGYDISRIEFIQLSKDGNDATIYSYKENFKLFLKCLEVYELFFKEEKEFDEDEDWLEII